MLLFFGKMKNTDTQKLDLTISIVNWNSKGLLKDCLCSILNNISNIRYEVIVVDNNSTDGSVNLIEREFKKVILIKNKRNLGFAKANNQAFRRSISSYFLLLNPDTIAYPGAIELLVRFLYHRPEAGAVAPKLLNPDGSFQRFCNRFPKVLTMLLQHTYLKRLFPNSKHLRDYWMSYDKFDNEFVVEQPAAACLLIRRKAIKGDLMDERFPVFFNDVDLCKRIYANGYKIFFYPGARVMHYGGQGGAGSLWEEFPIVYFQGLLDYFRKYHGTIITFSLRIILSVNAFINFMVMSGIKRLNYKWWKNPYLRRKLIAFWLSNYFYKGNI